MYCEHCGGKIRKEDRFCEHCGKIAADNSISAELIQKPTESGVNSSVPDFGVGISKTQVITGILIVGVFLFAWYIFSSSSAAAPDITSPQLSPPPIAKLYTTGTVNVRSCDSTDCAIVGTYPPNQAIDNSVGAYSTITDISELPNWYPVTYSTPNGSTATGYVNKSFLSSSQIAAGTNAPTPTVKLTASTRTKKGLPEIIAEWSPSVALVVCSFYDGSQDSGSGFLTQYSDGSVVIVTNKHVITSETTGYSATYCSVQIPGDTTYYSVGSSGLKLGSYGDWGAIYVSDGDAYFNQVSSKNLPLCQQQAQTGDNVIVLGYPDYAGQFTNPTATQGIISGYATPYYTTSAQIESGNSGGVAINPDRDCYIGIPSAVQTGNYANLGRILNADIPFTLPY